MGVPLSKILEKFLKLQELENKFPTEHLTNYMNDINECTARSSHYNSQTIYKAAEKLKLSIEEYQTAVKLFTKKVGTTISSQHQEFLDTSELIYRENLENMTFDEHRVWAPLWPPNQTEFNYFVAQMSAQVNWQQAGLVVGAKDSSMINAVLGAEPMYIVERYSGYFNLQAEKFHPDQQRKMKFYKLDDIYLLPKNAFGIIAVYNEFPFLPWTITSLMLHQFASNLAPGGIIVFNYNNCETYRGFKEFENRHMVYTTPTMYIDLCSRLNLTFTKHYVSESETFSYMVFKKAGETTLIKKFPSVGYVKSQPSAANPNLHKKRIETIRKLINPPQS